MHSSPPPPFYIMNWCDPAFPPSLRCDYTLADRLRSLTQLRAPVSLDLPLAGGLLGANDVVEFVGEHGTGKTRLLYHTVAAALLSDCSLLHAASDDSAVMRWMPELIPKVLFVDCDGKFDIVLFAKILYALHASRAAEFDDRELGGVVLQDCLSRLLVVSPRDSEQLAHILATIASKASFGGSSGAASSHPFIPAVLATYPSLRSLGALSLLALDGMGAFHWQDRAWRPDSVQQGRAQWVTDLLRKVGDRYGAPVIWTRPIFYFPGQAQPALAALKRPADGGAVARALAAGPLVAAMETSSSSSGNSSSNGASSSSFPSSAPTRLSAVVVTSASASAAAAVGEADHVPLQSYAILLRTHLFPTIAKLVTRTILLTRAASGSGSEAPRSIAISRLCKPQWLSDCDLRSGILSASNDPAAAQSAVNNNSDLKAGGDVTMGEARSSSYRSSVDISVTPILARMLVATTAPAEEAASQSAAAGAGSTGGGTTAVVVTKPVPAGFNREGTVQAAVAAGGQLGIQEALLWITG